MLFQSIFLGKLVPNFYYFRRLDCEKSGCFSKTDKNSIHKIKSYCVLMVGLGIFLILSRQNLDLTV